MFDRIAGALRPDEHGDDGGPAPSLAQAGRPSSPAWDPGTARSTSRPAPATSRSRSRAPCGPAARSSAATSPSGCSNARAAKRRGCASSSPTRSHSPTPPMPSTPRRSASARVTSPICGSASAEMARVVRPGGRVVILEITTPTREPLAGFYRGWFDRAVPAARADRRPTATRTATSRARCAASRGRASWPRAMDGCGLRRIRWVLIAGGIIGDTRRRSPIERGRGTQAVADPFDADPRARRAVRCVPRWPTSRCGCARSRRRAALARIIEAGGKRLRPLLVFVAGLGSEASVEASRAAAAGRADPLRHAGARRRARRRAAAPRSSHGLRGPPDGMRPPPPATCSSRAPSPSSRQRPRSNSSARSRPPRRRSRAAS